MIKAVIAVVTQITKTPKNTTARMGFFSNSLYPKRNGEAEAVSHQTRGVSSFSR
jgi:hypothetical protein